MQSNLKVNREDKISQDIEDFKLNCLDEKKNYSTGKLKVTRDAKTEKPLLFYTQEMVRNNRAESDPFSHRQTIKIFSPSNLEAAADSALEFKYKDTLPGLKTSIPDYGAMTDISSSKMMLFADENTCEFMENVGISVESLGDDFTSIESVPASPFVEGISRDTTHLKQQLQVKKTQLDTVKSSIMDEVDFDLSGLCDDEFHMRIVQEKISDHLIQNYLWMREQVGSLEERIQTLNREVYKENSTKIKLPERIKEVNFDIFK
jgi:hypothetical protein